MSKVRRSLLNFWFLAGLFVLALALPPGAPSHADETERRQVDWLEPHGVSILDMVGEVPEDILRDAVIMYSHVGMLQYISGQRSGDIVTINARVTPRYGGAGNDPHTLVGCLGQPALNDTWPIVSPSSVMRVSEDGQDITNQAWLQWFAPGGRIYPLRNTDHFRYPDDTPEGVMLNGDGEIPLPVNRGCAIVFHGYRSNLTAIYRVLSPKRISIQMRGSESFVAHSYIGPGATGEIGGLASQMQRRYGNRHDKFALTIPADAEFALVTFPPTPVHPYVNEPVDLNLALPGSGTYRIGQKNTTNLSVDHVVSAPIPIFWQPRDADQSGGEEFLPTFTEPGELASLEYFVPPGISYNPCMRAGNCANDLLDRIFRAEYSFTIHYLKIERIAPGLDRIPLCQVGPSWSPSVFFEDTYMRVYHPVANTIPGTVPPAQGGILLPLVYSEIPIDLPPDDPTGCPCGWFDEFGRMLDFVAGPREGEDCPF
jgi:hypothetical protein